MIILAIDPAMSGPAGAAIVDPDAPRVLWLGVLVQPPRAPVEARYTALSAWLGVLWSAWGAQVELCACEDNYLDKNVATVKALAQCVGIARAHTYRYGAPFRLTNAAHTAPTLARIPGVLLRQAPGYAAIDGRHQEHAHCAAAVGWRAHEEWTAERLRRRAA